ncbi:ABC-type Fe3+-hydroxamate transport system substrate-binding protein [Paenibacillus sp. BK033]|uniref:AraC family transcriptional regulator n=1 Tax=Paenibacillus sp. BK033 TaxID=2512133 RepID=UPI0010E038D0|nr:helix-turn-helix domain-containing protein [Paenibacillus sp. BK033]TCM96418.1 ABC-type Fe3+-hydroxamate transport system substrate-binding protein [Paenibacillus sp. BK033]
MNNVRIGPGQQSTIAARLCYGLLDVQVLRDDPQAPVSDRSFIETNSQVLLLSNSSEGRLIIDGRLHLLKPGWMFVCAPGQLIEWTNYVGQPLELLMLAFHAFERPSSSRELQEPHAFNRECGTKALFPFLSEPILSPAVATGQLYNAIRDSRKQGTASAWLRIEAGLLELLSLVLSHRERQTEMALEMARLELERHYTSEMAIDSLARIAGHSRFHFMRLFKERYGKGVAEYRTELRIREAKRLMNEQKLTLAEIVERIGYKNESYFSSLFKKHTGFAPAVYQRNRQQRIAAYSWINLGQLLALQLIPIAAPLDHYWTDRYRNRYDFEVITPLSHHYEYNLHALRQANPDRIVAIDEFIPPEEQDKLRELAPVLFLSWREDWRTHLRKLARFLEREDEAEIWLRRYDRDVSAVKSKIAPLLAGKTVLVLAVSNGQVSVWGHLAGTVLYDDLEIGMPEAVRDMKWLEQVTASELSEYRADRILVHVGRTKAAEERWAMLSGSQEWQSLPAVQAEAIHVVFGYGCFEGPWNEHAAEPIGRLLNDIPELFGLAKD